MKTFPTNCLICDEKLIQPGEKNRVATLIDKYTYCPNLIGGYYIHYGYVIEDNEYKRLCLVLKDKHIFIDTNEVSFSVINKMTDGYLRLLARQRFPRPFYIDFYSLESIEEFILLCATFS